jgi:hypothetical protein
MHVKDHIIAVREDPPDVRMITGKLFLGELEEGLEALRAVRCKGIMRGLA